MDSSTTRDDATPERGAEAGTRASARATRPEDLYRHRTLAALAAAPGHDRYAYVLGRPLRARDRYSSVLYGGEGLAADDAARALSARAFSAHSPAFSPDGNTLAFLSKRGDHGVQVHLLPWHGGEARRLTDLGCRPTRIEAWSADGKALLVLASEDVEASEGPRVAEFLPYKLDGSGFTTGARTRLLRIDADTGEARRLVGSDFDVTGAQWSPDGSRLAYVRNASGRLRHRHELWIAEADGSNARRHAERLTSVYGVRWSPDGRALAFGGSDVDGDSRTTLWHLDLASDTLRELGGAEFELAVAASLCWHPDGDRVAVVCAHRGLQSIAVVPIAHGQAQRLDTRLRHVEALAVCGQRLLFTVASMRWPTELHSVRWDGSGERRHSQHNRRWAARRPQPHVRKRAFRVPDGEGGSESVEAWVLTPPRPRQGPYPVLLDMYGGPQSYALIDHAAHWYWNILIARGWAIVAPNAVGSGSYGKAFSRRLRGRWGELDLPQYLAILDALQAEGLADERIACAGKSYGGFLSAWAIGQTDRFKAAVVSAPVTNVLSHAATSDTGFYVSPYAMDASFDRLPELSSRLSPALHADRARTATLILQGEDDQRCPVGQAEELFVTLMRCTDEPVRMVVYPGENHQLAGTGTPGMRVDYHRRIVDWLEQHVG